MQSEFPRDWPRIPPITRSIDSVGADQDWPRVTLVTPSFNQAAYLEDTILSILNQDYPNLEYMIIDGGSSDGSVEIIQKYEDRIAYWESRPDRGQSHAINKGWARANGLYVWWLNADDMLAPNSLKKSVSYLYDNQECDMVYGDLFRINQKGELLGLYRYRDFDLPRFILNYWTASQAGALVRKKILDTIGHLDENYHFIMDRDYWIRLALSGGGIDHINEPLAFFRIHEESKTQSGSPLAVQEQYRLVEGLLKDPNLPVSVRERQRSVWSITHLACARIEIKYGEYQRALKEYWSAFLDNPLKAMEPRFWHLVILGLLGVLLGRQRLQNLRRIIRELRRRFL